MTRELTDTEKAMLQEGRRERSLDLAVKTVGETYNPENVLVVARAYNEFLRGDPA